MSLCCYYNRIVPLFDRILQEKNRHGAYNALIRDRTSFAGHHTDAAMKNREIFLRTGRQEKPARPQHIGAKTSEWRKNETTGNRNEKMWKSYCTVQQ